MDHSTAEVFDAVNLGGVGRRQNAQTGDEEAGPVNGAAVGADGPGAGGLVPLRGGHAGQEVNLLAQVVAVHHTVEVGQDLGPLDEPVGPLVLRVQVTVERVLVNEGLRVRQCSGV